jgi:hypothetical protein
MPELTRQWVLTSEAFYAAGGPDKFAEIRKEAFEYAQQVCDPRYTNWVKTEFIYF